MASSIRVALGVDGAKQFENAMAQSNAAIKALGSELKLATTQFDGAEKSEGALKKQNDILERTVQTLKDKLGEQEKALEAVNKQFGEGSTESLKFSDQINNTKIKIAEAENKIRDNANAVNELGKEEDNAKDKTSTFGEVLKANLASEAIIRGVKELGKALYDLATSAAFAADDILTQSAVTGLSTDALQEYEYMAKLVDVDVSTLTGSMSKLTKNMQTAKKGTGDAAKVFEELGVQVTDNDGQLRSNQEVFDEVIAKLAEFDNETQRDAYAMQIFGKSAQELNPLIKAGSDTIGQLRQEAHDVGYVMSGETLNSLVQTSDAFERMDKQVDALKNQIGVSLAPVITDFVTGLTDIIGKADEFTPIIVGATVAVGGFAIALNFSAIVETVTGGLTAMKTAVLAVNSAIAANPLALVIALLAGLAAALVTAYTTNDEFRDKVDAAWKTVKESISGAVDAIKTFFTVTIPEAAQKAVDWFTSIPDQMRDVGQRLLEGLWDGIGDKVGWLKGKVSGVVNTIKGWFTGKDGFDEHSPSKWSADVFKNVMLGGSVGITKGLPELMDTTRGAISRVQSGMMMSPRANDMQGMAAGIVNGVQTAVSGMGNGSMTVNLVMPDGTAFARYYLKSFIDVAGANGTPIANPT